MIFSDKHKVCVYETEIPGRFLAMCPDAVQLSRNQVAVPATLTNMRVLARAGEEVVSPILWDYDWPRNKQNMPTPFPQQIAMSAFTSLNDRVFNLSDMRVGKTMGTLWAYDYLMQKGIIKKALILTTLSTVQRTWEGAIYEHLLGRRTATVLLGARDKRIQLLGNESDFYILNHDGLTIGSIKSKRGFTPGPLVETILNREDINAIITDEGAVYKDSSTTRFKAAFRAIAGKQFYAHLTGTPTPNSPVDAWSQKRLVDPTYAEPLKMFKERTMIRLTEFKWKEKKEAAAIVADTLQPAIRFNRHECLGTLPIKPEIVDVELSEAQKKAYNQLKKELQTQLHTDAGVSQTMNVVNEASLRMKLIQIACGAVYGADREVLSVDCKPRLDVLKELIAETPYKVLVFAPLTSVVNMLYSELSKEYTTAMIFGGTSSSQRNQILQAFQNDTDPRIIVADPRTVAHGLTLTEADTIIWYAPTDHPEAFAQANCRIEGAAQKPNPAIYCLAGTSVEREAFRRLDEKQSLQGLILNLI